MKGCIAKLLVLENNFIVKKMYENPENPLVSRKIEVNSNDIISSEIDEEFWWKWCTFFAVCSVLSTCLIFALFYIIRKYFPVQEKDIIKFSSQKSKDGWYSDNNLLSSSEHRILGPYGITQQDFVVIWS